MPVVEKPIFIVGTGRCGSSIFHLIMSHHPQVAWLSRFCQTMPGGPRANRWALRALDLAFASPYLRKLIYPVEAYRFWDRCFPGFSEPCRDLLKGDVTPRTREVVRDAMAQVLTSKRRRLLVKITGWPRIGFLKEIFPDAKFIHVYRDGRAVANSLLGSYWWSGWRGPDNWRWGELTPALKEKWEEYDRSFLALAAIQWEILISAQEEAKRTISSDDLLEIRYEHLCQEPVATFKSVLQFADLEWSAAFQRTVESFLLRDQNHKWREDLSAAQQEQLDACLRETLRKRGYA
ncbi:MAG: sulfotransferase [Anaerolineae bacterium]|nr:sulfotransferase [Anaerolineae bacterium]